MKLAKIALTLTLAFAVVACSSGPKPRLGRMPPNDVLPKGDQGVKRKVGNPYKVAGVWYHPKENPTYDQTGYASWYGKDFHGKATANGEVYNMNALTAAHKTLPMPSYVKVTNLQNNRSIILRVNDRGPFVAGRLIDVSRRGAQLLGFQKQGVTRVRIQASNANGKVARSTRASRRQIESRNVSRVPTSKKDTSGKETHYVQVGSYSSQENATLQANKLRRSGHPARVMRQVQKGKAFWRVRIGPFLQRLLAQDKLDRVVADGFYDARIFTETAR